VQSVGISTRVSRLSVGRQRGGRFAAAKRSRRSVLTPSARFGSRLRCAGGGGLSRRTVSSRARADRVRVVRSTRSGRLRGPSGDAAAFSGAFAVTTTRLDRQYNAGSVIAPPIEQRKGPWRSACEGILWRMCVGASIPRIVAGDRQQIAFYKKQGEAAKSEVSAAAPPILSSILLHSRTGEPPRTSARFDGVRDRPRSKNDARTPSILYFPIRGAEGI